MYRVTVLEAVKSGIEGSAALISLPRPLSLACGCPSLSHVLTSSLYVCLCPNVLFHKDISQIGSGPIPMTSFYRNHLCEGLISNRVIF